MGIPHMPGLRGCANYDVAHDGVCVPDDRIVERLVVGHTALTAEQARSEREKNMP